MTPTAWLLAGAIMSAGLLIYRCIGVNLSLASVLISLMILFHGPAYLYYTRIYGPDTDFFDTIISAAKGQDPLPTLDLALALTFMFVCFGILFANLASQVSTRRWKHALEIWALAPIKDRKWEVRRIKTASSILAAGVMLPFILIDNQLPKVINYFTSDLSELGKIALRREGGGSDFYLYNLLLANIFPFVAFSMIGLLVAKAKISRAQTFGFIALVALGKAATLSKAPLTVFMLQCLIVWLMLHRLTLSWQVLAGLLTFSTLLFGAMSWIANPASDEFLLVMDFLFYRVFMIVNEGLVEYFSAIPYVIDHSWGAQSSWVAGLFQTTPRLPTFWLVGEVHRGEIGSTTTVMFLGDAWADFAWLGVMVTAFIVGALTRWIDIQLIVRRGKSIASASGLALGHFGLFIALSTSFQTALVTGGLALIVPLVGFLSQRPRAGPKPLVLISAGSGTLGRLQ